MVAKRTLLAVGFFALTFLVLLAGAGAALADREPGAMPGRLQVAEPRPGDHAVYSLALLVEFPAFTEGLGAGMQQVPGYGGEFASGGEGQAFYIDAGARMVLDRAADRLLPAPDGGLVPAASYITTWSTEDFDWSFGGGWGMGAWAATSARVEAEAWKVVHTVGPDVVAVTLPTGEAGGDLPGRELSARLGVPANGTVTLFQSTSGPCGFHSAAQGREHELSKPLRVEGQCPPAASLLGETPSAAGHANVLASGHDDWQGQRATVFAHVDGAEKLRLWFAPAVPYPVRILTQVVNLEDQIKVHLLYEMTQFGAGAQPMPTPPGFGPLLETRQAWGLSEGAVGHPFPLSAAWQAARDDQAQSAFWGAHPDAQADTAHFLHWEGDGATEERWSFVANDGAAARSFDVVRRTAPVGAGTLPAPLVGLVPLEPQTTVTVEGQDVASAGRLPPALMPADLPGVVPLLERWAVTTSPSPESDLAWSFRLCDGCAPWAAAGAAASLDGALTYSFLGVRPDGAPAFVEESHGPYQVPGETSPDMYGSAYVPSTGGSDWSDPRGYGLAFAGFGVGLWTFPKTETAAGAGLAAAFVGLLAYFLAPLVKGGLPGAGAVGLFSRIGPDEVLDHPLRSQIVSLVEAEPGLHFQELARRLDTGRGTLEHHLRKLVAAELLSAQPSQGFTCYFPKGKVDRRIMAAAPVLKSDGARLVLQAIANQPGRAAQDVAATTGLTPSTVNYHLKRLSGVGLVETIRRGRFTLLTPTSIGQQALGTWSGT